MIYVVRICWVFLVWMSLVGAATSQERLIESFLEEGQITAARGAVTEALKANPKDDNLLLQLAITQFLGAVERFSQTMYGYGLDSSAAGSFIPFLRFPVQRNLLPRPSTNASVRLGLSELLEGLTETGATLAMIDDTSTVKVPVRIGLIRLDLDGDGTAGPEESLWSVYSELNPSSGWSEERARQLGARFDAADVRWLEGYTHLLSALIETVLTYNTERLWNHTAHLFFGNPTTPYSFLKPPPSDRSWGMRDFVDYIALIHLIDLPVLDASHATLALNHMQQVTKLSRRSWKLIMTETDDDYEWIPSPKQKGVLPNSVITPEMVTAWQAFLDETDSILAGTTLVPFWREDDQQRGLNFRRVFTEPARLDLVLWVQGTAAVSYLEHGTITSADFWERLSEAFQGNFLGYAAWLN